MVALYIFILGGSRASYRNHVPQTRCVPSPRARCAPPTQTRCAPSPVLRGRVGEGVSLHARVLLHAPSLSLPRKRGRGRKSRSRAAYGNTLHGRFALTSATPLAG